jgi:hypothetical protein
MKFRIAVISFLALFFSSCFKEDKDIPVITLYGNNDFITPIGQPFVDPGYKAIDNKDGNITYLVDIEGTVDSSKAGLYYLNYNVTDASGNKAIEKNRTVYVTHNSESLSSIYQAEGLCNYTFIDNTNHFVVIEPAPGNIKKIHLKAINNFSTEGKLIGILETNIGSVIKIPEQIIKDTTYSGSGTINITGSEISLEIYIAADNFADTCKTFMYRTIR